MASIIAWQVIGSPFSARTLAAAFRQLNWPSWPLACVPFPFAFRFVLVLLLSLMVHLQFRWMLPSSGRARHGPALTTVTSACEGSSRQFRQICRDFHEKVLGSAYLKTCGSTLKFALDYPLQ